jgi:hypothetical protein
MPDDARPSLDVGASVTLNGKPASIRRVLATEWHAHRYQFVYIVETSAPDNFRPYWFLAQLTVVGSEGDR